MSAISTNEDLDRRPGDHPDLGDSGPILVEKARALQQTPVCWHPQYGFHLDWPVLVVIVSIAAMSALAFVTQLNLLYWGAALGTAALVVSLVFPGRMIFAAEITKLLPDNGVVSEPMSIKYHVRNRRTQFGLYSLRLVELIRARQCSTVPRVYIPYIGPGQTCSFQVFVTPTARGQLEFRGTRLASRYPFGLLTRFRTIRDGRKITIYPALGKLNTRFLPGQRRTDLELGMRQYRHSRGDSTEFYSLREYRHGDNPRLIHWKRSARMGELLVREMTQFAPYRFTVILDTYLSDLGPEQRTKFEQAVSFVATLLCNLLERGYRVALICASAPPTIIPPISGREAQHRILRTLASVEPQEREKLSELVRTWRWGGRWRGKCLLVGTTDPGQGPVDRLTEAVGPVQTIQVGSLAWSKVFVPPAYLRSKMKTDL